MVETFGERITKLAQRLTFTAEQEGYELNELFAACALILWKAAQREEAVREAVKSLCKQMRDMSEWK